MSDSALSSNPPTVPKKGMGLALPTLALTAFAVFGNAFNLPLFFSVDLIFGSIAAFVALRKLGFIPAIIVGLIGSAYTISLWGHSYAFIIFAAEIVTVGLLRKYIKNLVYADIIFWLGLGVPLIWIFYCYYLGADENSTTLIILKQPLNGVFNAICASLILNLGAIYAPQNKTKPISVSAKKLTTNILLLLTLISGAFPIILDSYRAIESREAILEELMENYSLMFFENPETGQLNRYISLPKADHFFKSQAPILKGISLAFVDQNNNVIYQQGEIKNIQSNGKVIPTKGKMKIWHPDQKIAGVLLWSKGEYFIKQTVILDDQLSYMIISQSAQPIVNFIIEQRLQTMVSLLILLIGALIASHILSNVLVGPIQRLDEASTKFRTKIGSKQHFAFPESRISEYENLASSLGDMANHIKDSIIREEALRQNIDGLIDDKTRELKRLSLVASETTSAIAITDPTGKIEWINTGYSHLTGYKPQEVVGQYQKVFLGGPKTSNQTNELMDKALKNGEAFNGEILYYGKNRKSFWADVNISPIYDEHHQIAGQIFIQRDISMRVSEIERLTQKQSFAEDANERKSEILVTMSHEIRTPLNSILGLTELIADSGLNQAQMSNLKMIQLSGHNLLTIVNDVLDIVNIETGGVKVENTSFSLNNLLSTCISGTNSLAHEKGLKFQLKESGTCPRTLVGDPLKLRQILWNLASHAVKSTAQGSIIVSLDCSTHQFDEKVKEKRETVLHLSVRDSNASAENHLQQRSKSHFKANSNDNDRFKGAGPSISVVSGLVKMMQGSMSIKTEPDKGTTYDVYLPFNKTTEEEAKLIENKTEEFIKIIGSGNDILVAEDNPTNAMIARAFLEKNGQHVRVAENGMQAMTEVRKKRPDLIFLDVYMPEMNGMEVAEKLRRAPENSGIPIIGLTAEAFEERHEEFLKSGMNDIIIKPFTEIQLQQVMVKFLAHKNPARNAQVSKKQEKESDLTEVQNAQTDVQFLGNESLMRDAIHRVGKDTFNSILKTAPDDVRAKIKLIDAASVSSDFTQLKEASHSLVGTSSSLFATKLHFLAQEIERNADNKKVDLNSIQTLKSTAEETINWWNSFIDEE